MSEPRCSMCGKSPCELLPAPASEPASELSEAHDYLDSLGVPRKIDRESQCDLLLVSRIQAALAAARGDTP